MATKFSMKDPNPGVWFKFDEKDPESGEICIRPVNASKRREMLKKCIKDCVEYKKGQRFEYQETNDDLYSELLWDYVITDWRSLEDDEDKPIECTKENKVKLMLENIGFAHFVGSCMEIVNEDIEERSKAALKN
jgi:CRISPR/Cas system-associated protein Cas7 (RAMP superfamily)